MSEQAYWIDGYFHEWWSEKVWICSDRGGIMVPKFATVKVEENPDRIYITKSFANKILRPSRVFDSTDKNDLSDYSLRNKINVPWVKEVMEYPPTALP